MDGGLRVDSRAHAEDITRLCTNVIWYDAHAQLIHTMLCAKSLLHALYAFSLLFFRFTAVEPGHALSEEAHMHGLLIPLFVVDSSNGGVLLSTGQ